MRCQLSRGGDYVLIGLDQFLAQRCLNRFYRDTAGPQKPQGPAGQPDNRRFQTDFTRPRIDNACE